MMQAREAGREWRRFVLFCLFGWGVRAGMEHGMVRGGGMVCVCLFVCLLVIGVCVGGGMRCGVVCDGAMQGT